MVDKFCEKKCTKMSLFDPPTHFRDVTLAKKDFDERIGKGFIAQLAIACNTHMIMKILCPFCCTEFCFDDRPHSEEVL